MFRLCGWEKKSNTVKKVYFCVSIFVGHCEGPTMKLFVLSTHPPTTNITISLSLSGNGPPSLAASDTAPGRRLVHYL